MGGIDRIVKMNEECGMEQEIETAPATSEPGESKPASFPGAVLTVEQWGQVERACVAGMSYAEASRVFQVTQEAVRQRAFREQWLTPIKIERMKREQAVTALSQQGAVSQNRPETAVEAVATSFEGYRSRTLLQLAKAAENGIKRMVEADLPIENWQDAKSAADIAMKLHNVGQDSVQVNIAQAFAGMDEGPVVSIEGVNDEDETVEATYFTDDD